VSRFSLASEAEYIRRVFYFCLIFGGILPQHAVACTRRLSFRRSQCIRRVFYCCLISQYIRRVFYFCLIFGSILPQQAVACTRRLSFRRSQCIRRVFYFCLISQYISRQQRDFYGRMLFSPVISYQYTSRRMRNYTI